jgi:hypothetical protein
MRAARVPDSVRALLLAVALPAAIAGASPREAAAARAPAAPAPATAGALAARFAQPDQTLEYHFMIRVPALAEADLSRTYQAGVVEPLKGVAELGPLGNWKPDVYVDSPGRDLRKHHLIVRVRRGRIAFKERAASPSALLDLEACTSRKYEMDWFGRPEYSISTEIAFDPAEFDATPPALTTAKLWDFVERKCPGMWRQVRPLVVRASQDLQVPGVAHMYGAQASLKIPAAAKVKEASVAVWFFPPTDRFLVELSFTGFVRDRAGLDSMYTELKGRLQATGLLQADQSSKTEQYFDAYLGPRK